MITVLQINSGIVGSTGTIMLELDEIAQKEGMKTYIASVTNKTSKKDYPSNHICIGTIPEKHIHRKMAMRTGLEGGYSYFATKRFLKKIDKIKPDIIHLHNLHWCYINLELLFNYLKQHEEIKVVWTLHDCWAFTGHCPHYEMAGCIKWQTECHDCSLHMNYPVSYKDNSQTMYRRKKSFFSNHPNLTLVTPSLWINGEVQKSFLKDYPSRIICNGVDTSIFYPRGNALREKYGLTGKFVILGAAYNWNERKGFDVFLKLSQMLNSHFQIVLVGNFTEEQQKLCESHGILCLPFCTNRSELAELYSMSDVLFNPTREEMFGLVNIEAEACGVPVITFRSGGSPECIGLDSGFVVEKEDIRTVVDCIEKLNSGDWKKYSEAAIQWAIRFEKNKTYQDYIQLYKELGFS